MDRGSKRPVTANYYHLVTRVLPRKRIVGAKLDLEVLARGGSSARTGQVICGSDQLEVYQSCVTRTSTSGQVDNIVLWLSQTKDEADHYLS